MALTSGAVFLQFASMLGNESSSLQEETRFYPYSPHISTRVERLGLRGCRCQQPCTEKRSPGGVAHDTRLCLAHSARLFPRL